MISSRERAFEILRKWRSESSLLQVVIRVNDGGTSGFATQLFGFVAELRPERLVVSAGSERCLSLNVNLPDETVFTCGDSGDAPDEETQLLLGATYVCFVTFRFPSNSFCLLAEIRKVASA